jgi:tRNA uridine 5-carboxymethylaminomethyl modification enzyme
LQKIELARVLLSKGQVSSSKLLELGIRVSQDGQKRNAFDMLGLQNGGIEETIRIFPEVAAIDINILRYLYIESKYNAYLDRQNMDIELFKQEESVILPRGLDYSLIGGLSNEVVEKLKKHQPLTISAAKAIQGITPSAIMAIIIYLKSQNV